MWSKFPSIFVLRPLILLSAFCLVPDRCWAQTIPNHILPLLQPSGSLLEGALLSLVFFAIAIAMPLCAFLMKAENKAYLSVSLTALCAGVYSLSATGLGPFLITLTILWHYLAMISLFLLPVGICKFLTAFCPEVSVRFYLHYFEKGHTAFALLSLIGVTTGLCAVTIPLKLFFLLLILTYIIFFFIVVNCIRLGKVNTEIIMSGLLIFLASCILSSLNTVLGGIVPLDFSVIWGLLGLLTCLLLSLRNTIGKQHGQTVPSIPDIPAPSQSAHKPSYQAETSNWKTTLLSFIHEINTPLGTGLLATSHLEKEVEELYELFRSDELKKSDLETHLLSYKESAAIISANFQNAVNILRAFKTDSNTDSQLPRQTFNVGQYMEQLLIALRPRINQAGHQIHFSCPDNLIITSYPSMFSQIIANLIMNSLTHGYPNGKNGNLSLEISASNNSLHLKYSDDGKGIEKKLLNKLFDPYFTTNKDAGNSGLGLFIVYTLVTERLGGSIDCQSIPGKMTTFFIQVTVDRR